MDHKIKAVKLYQSATFEKRSETHFTVLPVSGKVSPALSFNKELMCIDIVSANDHILVPLTNIAAIYLWNGDVDECLINSENTKRVNSENTPRISIAKTEQKLKRCPSQY